MTKESFENYYDVLDPRDIAYLRNLLHTIETTKELRELLVPQEDLRNPSGSNFVRVEYKLSQLTGYYYSGKWKPAIIPKPAIPLQKSRLCKPLEAERRKPRKKKTQ